MKRDFTPVPEPPVSKISDGMEKIVIAFAPNGQYVFSNGEQGGFTQ
jgi:hypothetical protein